MDTSKQLPLGKLPLGKLPFDEDAWKDEMEPWEKEIMEESKRVAFIYGLPFSERIQILILNALRRVPDCKCRQENK